MSASSLESQALYFNIAAEADDTSLPVTVNNPGINERDMFSVSLKLDWETDAGTLTSITAYDDTEEQLTGDQFTNTSAVLGNDISTFPDFPAEIRAPAGTLAGLERAERAAPCARRTPCLAAPGGEPARAPPGPKTRQQASQPRRQARSPAPSPSQRATAFSTPSSMRP